MIVKKVDTGKVDKKCQQKSRQNEKRESVIDGNNGAPYFSHFSYRISLCSRVYMYLLWMPSTVTAKANDSWQKHFAHDKSKFSHGKIKFAHGKNKFTHGKSKCNIFIVEVSLFSECCYSSQYGIGFTHCDFHWPSLRDILLISYISKCKSKHAHIFWVISFALINIVLTGLLATKACRNQKFFGVKLPIKFKQTRLNWCTLHGKIMALGICVHKSYERSKSLICTCFGLLA